jgi:SEC-C motif-containing protein
MRSRYTAYVRRRVEYLLDTWHPDTRPAALEMDPRVRWLGLEVRATEQGRPGDGQGSVEFVARCKRDGRARRIHEVSRFTFQDGRWLYVDGELRER